MKKYFKIIMMALALTSMPVLMLAQPDNNKYKERQESIKASKKELNEKATKAAKKEAKKLTKEGWKAAPGALPLEKQLDRSYIMEYEFDDDMLPKYMFGDAMSVGGNYDAAKMQAQELAKQDLAGKIQSEVASLIENSVSNEQLDNGDAESITRSVMASKDLIAQSLGRTIPAFEAYRTLSNGNKEVRVRIAYNSQQALEVAKRTIRKDLEKKGEELHDKLDQILGW